jgi:acyl carrier protein
MTDVGTDVVQCISELLRVDASTIRRDMKLSELVPDSFALVELIIDLQDVLGTHLTQADFVNVRTVEDLASIFGAST